MSRSPSPWRRRLKWIAVVVLSPVLAHLLIVGCTRMDPPRVAVHMTPPETATDDPGRRQLGRSYVRMRGAIREVRLAGNPETIGHTHALLLRDDMVDIETDLRAQLSHFVPWAAARVAILDLARLRFTQLDRSMTPERRLEIAAQARAFQPDPFSDMMETYQRFVFLHSLYDIMLSFERSPLVGCTSFVVSGEASAGGHTLVGRNFDFEGPQILDEKKAVFLAFEEDRIPYASVSWPGFIGASTGMNAYGVAVVVHGARAGQPRTRGEPVAHTVRDLLARAHSTRAAIALLGSGRDTMVSHMLLIADSTGDAVVVERIPGRPPFVRSANGDRLPLTNHLEGPGAGDPKNHEVRATSTTLARRARLDELLVGLQGADARRAAAVLRDKQAAAGRTLPLGHRDAIDALIATHSVLMDTSARVLWVNEGPHAMGRYVRFDLGQLLAPDYWPQGPADVETLPADDIVEDGRYDQWRHAGSPHHDNHTANAPDR